MALDLLVVGAAVLGLIAAGLGSFAILNVIGDSIAFFTAVCVVGPAAILVLLSAFGVCIAI
jgi:hypothetical protein